MKVRVNDTCMGCGACMSFAPEVFTMGAGKAEVLPDADLDANRDAIVSAQNACPAQSIEVEE